MRRRTFFTLRAALCLSAGGLGSCAPAMEQDAGRDVSLVEISTTCAPLRIDPAMPRVATERSITLRALGGSGVSIFRVDGESLGATVDLGGGFNAGMRAGSVAVVARDGVCGLEARTQVEVVGPFDVQPARALVMPSGTVDFRATGAVGAVHYEILTRPSGAGMMGSVDETTGRFTAGTAMGEYALVARDEGSGKSQRLTAIVGMAEALRPLAAVVAVPRGMSVPLRWRGGSGAFTVTVSGAAGGRVTGDGASMIYDAADAMAGFADVSVVDRGTAERATVRVLVGDSQGPEPQARGTQLISATSFAGEIEMADVNGDGRKDMIVGHAERSFVARNAGGILVYYAAADGGFAAMPDTVIEGGATEDRLGVTIEVGDVNGDMIADVIAGVPDQDLGEADRGAVQIYLGSPEGLQTTAAKVLSGEDNGNRFGASVAIRDLDGDSKPELIVTAPSALNPSNRSCFGGRIYVYRPDTSTTGGAALFESVPSQVIDVRAPFSDTPTAAVCAPTRPGIGSAAATLNAGVSTALLDVDGDGKIDLAVGAPAYSHTPMVGLSHGGVLVYRGTATAGRFEQYPAWVLQLDATTRGVIGNAANFGINLDVVRDGAMAPEALVVRSYTVNGLPAMTGGAPVSGVGGFWVFDRSAFGMADAESATRPVRVINSDRARTFAYGRTAGRGLGRSAVVGDIDGDGSPEYALGAFSSGAAGVLAIYRVRDMLTMMGALPMPTEFPLSTVAAELAGFRVGLLAAPAGQKAGLVSWAMQRSTTVGPFVGALDYVLPGTDELFERWAVMASRRSILLQNRGAGDRAGTTVGVGSVLARGSGDMVVGAPGAHSPEIPPPMMRPAGELLNTGAIETYAASGAPQRAPSYTQSRALGSATAPFVLLDFDGDGKLEVAIGDSVETSGAVPMGAVAAPGATCNALGMGGAARNVGNRGVVRIFTPTATMGLVERWRAVPRSESQPTNMGWRYNRFGSTLAVADTNGDGKDDLIVGRPGGAATAPGQNGAEVVLGRAPDAMDRMMIVCNVGDAPRTDSAEATALTIAGLAVGGVADIDGDGCDEAVFSVTRNGENASAAARSGLLVSFGFGAMCGTHTTPFEVLVTADEHAFDDNRAGDVASRANDTLDLPGLAGSMGRVFALGRGDFDGDGFGDIVYRTADLGFGAYRGPAVEVLSSKAFRAGGVCGAGRDVRACVTSANTVVDGAYRAFSVRTLTEPMRYVVPTPSTIVTRWGTSIALGDVSGDGFAELFVGSPDSSNGGSFSGAVLGWRGGSRNVTQSTLFGDPWLIAVGDPRERSDFGTAVAASTATGAAPRSAWLVAGAPLSSRDRRGGELGAGYRWRVQLP